MFVVIRSSDHDATKVYGLFSSIDEAVLWTSNQKWSSRYRWYATSLQEVTPSDMDMDSIEREEQNRMLQKFSPPSDEDCC